MISLPSCAFDFLVTLNSSVSLKWFYSETNSKSVGVLQVRITDGRSVGCFAIVKLTVVTRCTLWNQHNSCNKNSSSSSSISSLFPCFIQKASRLRSHMLTGPAYVIMNCYTDSVNSTLFEQPFINIHSIVLYQAQCMVFSMS